MTSENLWRTVALGALAGWATTAVLWGLRGDPDPTEGPAHSIEVRAQAPRAPRRLARADVRTPSPPSDVDAIDLHEVRRTVRNEVLSEIEEERVERERLRSEHRLDRALDGVAQFAEEHGLDPETAGTLEASMADMHDRMERLRPLGPPEPGGPPPELREAIERSEAQLEAEALEALEDSELAAEFVEWMRPPGPRPPRPVAD